MTALITRWIEPVFSVISGKEKLPGAHDGALAEAIVVSAIADALLEKMDGNHMAAIAEWLKIYLEMLRGWLFF